MSKEIKCNLCHSVVNGTHVKVDTEISYYILCIPCYLKYVDKLVAINEKLVSIISDCSYCNDKYNNYMKEKP